LTNYLHFISQSTADELTKTGIINLHLLLTAKKIYVENLNIGAGGAESKKQFFRVPLISSTNEDSWEDFFGIDFLPMADKVLSEEST
jgi:hypothetical protein